MDLTFLGVTVVFFAATYGLQLICERLAGKDSPE